MVPFATDAKHTADLGVPTYGFSPLGSMQTSGCSTASTGWTSESASPPCAGACPSCTTWSAASAADGDGRPAGLYSVGALIRRPRREIAWVANAATPIATMARSPAGSGRTAPRN